MTRTCATSIVCAVCMAGCATKSQRALEQQRRNHEMESIYQRMIAPVPPKIVRSEADKARTKKSQELHPFIARSTYTFHVEDCEPQPEGVSYRVYETTDLKTWTLNESATIQHDGTNHSVTVRCDKPMGFFSVTAFVNGWESKKAGKDCK